MDEAVVRREADRGLAFLRGAGAADHLAGCVIDIDRGPGRSA